MENQKLLWIVFSVALFFVVVLASALYFLKPGTAPEGEVATAAAEQAAPIGFDSYEYVRGPAEHLPVESGVGETEAPRSMQIVVGEQAGAAVSRGATSGDQERSTAQAAAKERTGSERPKETVIRVQPKQPATVVRRATPSSTRKATSSTATAPVATHAPAATGPARLYWIQAGSFTNRGRAEQMVSSLSGQGVQARIQVKEVRGTAYYRVRIGPYREKSEAEKFLSWMKAVKGLENSYVSMVYVKR